MVTILTDKRIAFIKFGGMSAGGTERWLQEMAVELTKRGYPIDFFFCEAAAYLGSDYKHAGTDISRLNYMKANKVNLIEFKVGLKDLSTPAHNWIDTNFWDVFNQREYLFAQSATSGNSEYPFNMLEIPVLEFVSLSGSINRDRNVAWTIHLSEWQRQRWLRLGGSYSRSSVIPIPAFSPATNLDLRAQLGIEAKTLVFGFHQRSDENIFSEIPIKAYGEIESEDTHFILMGGSDLHRTQAFELGIERISFLDHDSSSESISKFLNSLDVYTHGRSDGETFGSVIAEAMMHALPVISHRVKIGANAQKETIGPGGFFAKNIQEYVEYMSRFISDSNLRTLTGMNGLNFANLNYSLNSAANKLTQIYGHIFPAEFPSTVGAPFLNGNHSKAYILENSLLAVLRRVKDKFVYQIKVWRN